MINFLDQVMEDVEGVVTLIVEASTEEDEVIKGQLTKTVTQVLMEIGLEVMQEEEMYHYFHRVEIISMVEEVGI